MNPNAELIRALELLLETGRYSDLTIRCQQKTFGVHRAIICSRSSFFDAACSSGFLEAESQVIDLSSDDSDSVKHMIDYLYKLDYDLEKQLSVPKTGPFYRRHSPLRLDFDKIDDPLLATAATVNAPDQSLTGLSQETYSSMVPSPIYASSASSSTTSNLIGNSANSSHYSSNVDSRKKRETPVCGPRKNWLSDSGVCDQPESPKIKCVFSHTNASKTLDQVNDQEGYEEQKKRMSALLSHARVYALAEKYGIKGLKGLAKSKFSLASRTEIKQPNADLTPLCKEEFARVVEEVWQTTIHTDLGLRDVCLRMLYKDRELAEMRELKPLVWLNSHFRRDLFKVRSLIAGDLSVKPLDYIESSGGLL